MTRPSKSTGMAYWLEYFMEMTITDFDRYLEKYSDDEMNVKERTAYNYASKARTDPKVAKEVYSIIKKDTFGFGICSTLTPWDD